ncbi:hypothetical protein [Streptomyces sp. NPDC005408]|uniref:hypothetical protein n=1 Tax=Streptomyces sp. NPDC005408 TaxID=3155341 RepID=UPI0033B12312
MARIPRPRRAAAVVVAALVVTAGGWTVFHRVHAGLERAKDRRDLADLTRPAPWPRDELRVPDGTPREGATGEAYETGFSVSLPLATATDPRALVTYRMHQPSDGGALAVDGASCGATKILTCKDIGDGIIEVVTRRSGNSDPSLALYQRRGDRVFSVTAHGVRTDEDRLRQLLTRTHRASDEELLRILRPPGYRTDWS